MEKADFLKIVQKIRYAYGNRFQEVTNDMLYTWFQCLGSLDAEILNEIVTDYVRESIYPPTIADLRNRYFEKRRNSVNLACKFAEAASYYPDGWRDSSAEKIYREKFSHIPKEQWENQAENILEQVKQYVAVCEQGKEEQYTLPSFGDYLKEISDVVKKGED